MYEFVCGTEFTGNGVVATAIVIISIIILMMMMMMMGNQVMLDGKSMKRKYAQCDTQLDKGIARTCAIAKCTRYGERFQ